MKKLLKEYNLLSDMSYFEMIATSFRNSNREQAISQFVAMPKKYKVSFLKSATVGGWGSNISSQNLSLLFDNL